MSHVSKQRNITLKMAEEKIFEFLLPKQYDYPLLHSEAAEIIAANFTNIIYDSLKLKSCAATDKRLNLIKFLKTLSSSPDNHLSINHTNYQCIIDSLRTSYSNGFDPDLSDFLNENSAQLREKVPENLCIEVLNFYKRKNQKHKKKIKTLETIKKFDQEALIRANFSLKVTKKMSYYETSDSVITNLLSSDENKVKFSKDMNQNCCDDEYRDKQIEFAYALVNLNDWKTIELVLNRLANYKNLTKLEINFLNYLNDSLSNDGEYLRQLLIKNFMFIFEKILIQICTEIIQVEGSEVGTLLSRLQQDYQFLIIKNLCKDNLMKLKFKHLLYELYSYSYCNVNLLRLIDSFE